jgi:superfamily II DNA or RNA helicase
MITIILNNSTSRVVGLNKENLKKLRFAVAYFNMSIWIRTKNRYAATALIIDENGFFPTGLLKRVCRHLAQNNVFFHVADNRIVPNHKKLNLKDKLLGYEPPLYPEQDLAANAIMNNEAGVCEMPTGIGKSRVIKEALVRTQRPTLVITPSSNLRQQTYEYLSESFGTDDIGLLKFGHDKPVVVTNFHALSTKDASYFKQFSQLIFDEFHNAAAEGVRDDFADRLCEIYFRYGMTATNFKNDASANIYLESILSETLYSVTTIDAINKGYIRPLVSFFFDISNNVRTTTKNYKKDVPLFIDNNPERNSLTVEHAKKMIQNNIPTIILVEHIGHGRQLQNAIGKDALFLNGQDESATYNMQMVKKFNNLEVPCLIGTSVLGEGVDTKAAGAIFNCGGGKAESELMQKCGRVVRNFRNKQVGYYFDFIDNGQKNLIAHSRQRMSTIQTVYGKSVNIIR